MRQSFNIKSIAFCAFPMPVNVIKAAFFAANQGAIQRFMLMAIATFSLLVAGCATPQPPAPKAVYDFGPMLSASAAAQGTRAAAVALPEIEAGAGLDSPALLYRLQYDNAQQLRPYAAARWSVPPSQLVRTRLRDTLAAQGPVLATEGYSPWVLRIELDEFSQLFSSPQQSEGVVRLRVSLLKSEQLAAQTTILARAAAPSQDAAGGVRALTAATDEAVRQLASWLSQHLK